MPDFFDYEDGGSYDVPTSSDYERWEEERLDEERQRRYDNATEEERNDPLWDVPY